LKVDSLFYRLFQNWPQLALSMLQLSYNADSYEFVSLEIKQTGFRIDGLFKPLDSDHKLPLIFAEVQYQPDPDFYGRFCSEIMLYLYRHKPRRDWLALVIYPSRATEKPHPIEFALFANAPQLKRIYLEDYRQLHEPGFEMLKLLACKEDETPQLAQTMAAQPDKLSKEMLEFIETVLSINVQI
jgi:predicted transposase/invertase (TIGR01784 family)